MELMKYGKVKIKRTFIVHFRFRSTEELIIKNSTDVKKLHFYYLLSDKEGYIKNNKILPVIYPEYAEIK